MYNNIRHQDFKNRTKQSLSRIWLIEPWKRSHKTQALDILNIRAKKRIHRTKRSLRRIWLIDPWIRSHWTSAREYYKDNLMLDRV